MVPRVEETNHTVVIPVLAPFEVTSAVSYRQAAKPSGAKGWSAAVSSMIRAPGPRPVHLQSMTIRNKVSFRLSRRISDLE